MQIIAKYNRATGWEFRGVGFTLTIRRKLGKEKASQIATQVGAGLKRTGGKGLDGMARGAIRRLEFGE